MRKLHKFLSVLCVLSLSFQGIAFPAFEWGSTFDQGDLKLKKNKIQWAERTTPSNPPTDNIFLYAKDNAGTTALYTLDSSGTETEIGSGGGGGVSTLGAIGSSPNANGATISGSTLNLEPASASFGGVVTTGTQTFAGSKTVTDTFTHLQTASTANTVVDGLALINNTTPSSGNQMYSGALYWKGKGWKTNSGGGSTDAEFRAYILPVQGTTAAEDTLVFQASQNGAGFNNVMQLRMNSSAPQVLFEFGTVSLPGLSYRVDPDTGLRRSGTNAQALVAGGVDALYVDVNGAYVGTAGINSTQFSSHPTVGSKAGAVWRARNATTVDYWRFENDSATQEGSLFRSNATAGKWSLRLNGNSAATPAYSYYGDENSGYYTIGADTIGTSTGGIEAGRVDASQNFGFGVANIRGRGHFTTSTVGGTHTSTIVINNKDAGTGGVGTGPYCGIDFSHYIDSANDFQRKAAFGFEKTTTTSRGDFLWSLNNVADNTNVNYLTDEKMRLTMDGVLRVGSGTVGLIPSSTSTTFTALLTSSATSGSAGVSVGITDGARNGRAGLFFNDTDGIWGLSHSYSSTRRPFVLISNTTEQLRVDTSHRLGVGESAPTAWLHLKAGIATAGFAPLKFNSGTNLTTAEAGAFEYNGTNLFFTRSGTTRENVLVGDDGASAPTTTAIGVIADYYGTSATRVLTTPNSWVTVNIDGNTYKIPAYS